MAKIPGPLGGDGVSTGKLKKLTALARYVLKGYTFAAGDKSIKTGTLELTGSAADGDVLAGKTYYGTDPLTKRTGTLALSGNAGDGDVRAGKTYYNSDAKTKRAGTLIDRGNWNGWVGMNGSVTIPAGIHSGAGKVAGPTITDQGAWGATVTSNGSVTIPQGYHNGSGKVTVSVGLRTEKIGVINVPEYTNGSIYTSRAYSFVVIIGIKWTGDQWHEMWCSSGEKIIDTFPGEINGVNSNAYVYKNVASGARIYLDSHKGGGAKLEAYGMY